MTDIPPLFAAYTLSDRSWTGTFWWGRISDSALNDAYLEAARRLRSGGRSAEDLERVLLPVLFLYRQAIELQLKRAIDEAAALRRKQGDDAKELKYDAVQKQMKEKLGHKLSKLLAALQRHLVELGEEPLPKPSRLMIELLNETDFGGTSFRYPGTLKPTHVSIDLERLASDIESLYGFLDGLIGYLMNRAELEVEG